MLSYRDILRREFEQRQAVNERYSLRAFARDLALAPSRLSEVLNSRRGLSQVKGEAIAQRLKYPASLRKYFVTSIGAEHGRSAAARTACQSLLSRLPTPDTMFVAELEKSYNVVAWYYGALMELPRVIRKGFSLQTAAAALGISQFQIESADRYLKRLGFWQENCSPGPLRILGKTGLPKRLLRLNFGQILKLCENQIPVDQNKGRQFTTDCLAFARSDLPYVEDILLKTRRELYELSDQSNNPDAVYLYASQFLKLTKGDNS